MIGFRRHLSTQDALLQLKHQIIENPGCSTRAILGLDLKKAFDNVRHDAILRTIDRLNLGMRVYNYVRDFLTGRTARMRVGQLESNQINIGSSDTPQGSVISPMLFNLVLLRLPERLHQIDGLHHTLYADDITIWTTTGSDGEIEDRLQAAIECVEHYLVGTGLTCSAEKSELLLYRPVKKGRLPKNYVPSENQEIKLTSSNGSPIPMVKKIRVLGMMIEQNGGNGEALRKIMAKATSTMQLIRRITNNHAGMREGSVIRLIQAFVISQLMYTAPFHKWTVAEKEKLNDLIRKTYKFALGLAPGVSTSKLLELGLHNTLEELVEAQQVSQLERLSKTHPGRHLLEKLGITYHTQHGIKVEIPRSVREQVYVPPLPRNMHPQHHTGRRKARAQRITQSYSNDTEAVFTDPARYTNKKSFMAIVTGHRGKYITSLTVNTAHAEAAEEAAIALVLTQTNATYVISDSQTAIRNFANGHISQEAFHILQRHPIHPGEVDFDNRRHLLWIPAHTGLSTPNEAAHRVARGLTHRASPEDDEPPRGTADIWAWEDRMTRFHDITTHYQLQRRIYPSLHERLNRTQAVHFRQLQTDSYRNPRLMHAMYPDIYTTNRCTSCGEVATLSHMLWECQGLINNSNSADSSHSSTASLRSRWKAALLSSNLTAQLWAVQRAEEAASRQGLGTASAVGAQAH
ncbi:uncharacterized protein LOC142775204 [Rhipicephalus microplus]|uniref:uncharacterized protein LOC142775204 n=1 Tax=Rhipicephalus microplus TaxID=6941 RepID=UPI003F6D66F5